MENAVEELFIEYDCISTSLLMRKFKIPRIMAQDLLRKVSRKRKRFKLVSKDLLTYDLSFKFKNL